MVLAILFFFFCNLYFINVEILFQSRNKTPELEKGAPKAMYELYEVVTHDLLAPGLRYFLWR